MDPYDHQQIEQKWQREWLASGLYNAQNDCSKPKFYALIEFPYPSGDGLHVGHPRPYIGLDIVARKHRLMGQNVLYPIGWDAFGLPTENYAIKTGKDPRVVTKENSDNFRRQIQSLGISFDWSREINTTDPSYYKWTQWLFLQFYKQGLAYKQKTLINWCPKDKIGLANEEVIDGKCERCGTAVEQREKEQWLLAITKYADRLDRDLDTVDYLPQIKTQQRHWIGRKEGTLIKFAELEVFTTRPETIFGATYIAVAGKADRDTGKRVKNPATGEEIPVWEAEYVLEDVGTGALMGVPAHDERDFAFATKHNLPIKHVVIPQLVDPKNPHVPGKEIVFRKGVMAIVYDPKTDCYLTLKWKKQPWTTFVMGGIEGDEGPVDAARREIIEETGYKQFKFKRVLGGPAQTHFFAAHKGVNRIAETYPVLFELEGEERDEIAPEEKDTHEIVWISSQDLVPEEMSHVEASFIMDKIKNGDSAYSGPGVLITSGEFNGLSSADARAKMTAKFGVAKTTYKLRDWIFSRQRYWGEPIPMISCAKCGWVPVPDEQLPVTLPVVENYQPRDDGQSPLASVSEWVNVQCPNCGGEAKRETDTMPNWAGSSWYYLAYTAQNIQNFQFPMSKEMQNWLPVDWYNGGMEHTTLHLLYSRFWHKFLFDLGLVPTSEPYAKRTSHGLIMAKDGEKMSKSRGNVVNPDKIVELYGADTLRVYEMFMGPFAQAVAWNTDSIMGPRRFLERVWRLGEKVLSPGLGEEVQIDFHLKKVSDDIEKMSFNTAVSELMIASNKLVAAATIDLSVWKKFLITLSPFAPHLAAELWSRLGESSSIHLATWPEYQVLEPGEQKMTITVQINGVVRDRIEVLSNLSPAAVQEMALQSPKVHKHLDGKEVKKVVSVAGKLVNFVV